MQLTSFTYIIIPYINNLLGLFWNANRNISTNKKTYEKRFVDYCTFNNMQTLQFKAQPTNAFFATINQVLSDSSQLPTTAEGTVIKSMSTVQTTKQYSTVVGSWEEPPNIWLTVVKNAFVSRGLNFWVGMLLKYAVVNLYFYIKIIQRSCNTKLIYMSMLFS